MKFLFLGTSSGWPLPRLGCSCNICSSQDIKDNRLRPSILVNEKLLLDTPPDIYHQLKKFAINPTNITDIILTHAHDDHIMGLYDLGHIYQKKQKINLISTQGVLTYVRKKMGVSIMGFKQIEIKPFEKIELDSQFSGWLIPVIHSVEAYAIKIKAGKPLVYAPEFRKILPSSKKYLGDLELAIIDGSSKTGEGQAKGHETIEEGIRLGQEIKAKKILFTNIGHKTDRHEALEHFVKEKGGQKFGIAFDGLEITM